MVYLQIFIVEYYFSTRSRGDLVGFIMRHRSGYADGFTGIIRSSLLKSADKVETHRKCTS